MARASRSQIIKSLRRQLGCRRGIDVTETLSRFLGQLWMPVLRLGENSIRGIGESVALSTRLMLSPPQPRIHVVLWGTIACLNNGCSRAQCRGRCYTRLKGALPPSVSSRRT